MIKPLSEKQEKRIEIVLSSPQGNVFGLIAVAVQLGRKLNRLRGAEYFDTEDIKRDMMSSNYEHAVDVLEKHFSDYIIIYK